MWVKLNVRYLIPVRLLALLVAVITASMAHGGDADWHGAQTFLRHSDFSDVQMSPDGTQLSVATRLDDLPGALNLVVMDLETRTTKAITSLVDRDIAYHYWTGSSRIVFQLRNRTVRGTFGGLFSVRPDGTDERRLSASSGFNGIFDSLPALPDVALARVHNRNYSALDVALVNVTTGSAETIVRNDGRMLDFLADNSGQVRLATAIYGDPDELQYRLLHRPNNEAPWVTVISYRHGDLALLGFSEGNRYAYINIRLKHDRLRVHRFDTATGQWSDPVVEDPVYDTTPARMRLHRERNGKVISFTYAAAKPIRTYFDETWAARQRDIDAAMPPGNVNEIIQYSDDLSRFIVLTWSDRDAGSYHLYDEKKRSIGQLLAISPHLKPEQMASSAPVEFSASDGVTLHGYLTRPTQLSQDKSVPLILRLHNGPFAKRDHWLFYRSNQFLVSRGYAVLQVNYRGSGGYGRSFQHDARKRMGFEMQDDIAAARAWAIEQGIADPKRIVIYGSGFGGYAALLALTRAPDHYQAGIVLAAPVDLVALMKEDNADGARTPILKNARALRVATIGHFKRDKAQLREASPIHHIEQISAPLFIAHGTSDRTLSSTHYRRLVKALKKHDKDFETIYTEVEGHAEPLGKTTGVIALTTAQLYERIDHFLLKALGQAQD